jgi:hypothetical protein
MEAIYENFYEIHAYALTAGVIYLVYQPYITYFLHNSKFKSKLILHRKNTP